MNIFKNPKIALKHTEITLKLHLVRNHIFLLYTLNSCFCYQRNVKSAASLTAPTWLHFTLLFRSRVCLPCPRCPCRPCLLVWACSRPCLWCPEGPRHPASTWEWSPQVFPLPACRRMISWRWFSREQPWCYSRRREPSSRSGQWRQLWGPPVAFSVASKTHS